MNRTTLNSIILVSLLLPGCASQTGWTPTVDTYNDPNAARLNLDMSECQQLANSASGGTAKQTAIGAGVGGLLGAAGGAAVGAALGNPGTGAAIGAAAGGIGGGAQQGLGSEQDYKRAYSNCLRERGHKVIN
ncbi:MAG: glycine zipper family protein [Methylomonas sp.]|jgi:outer membrane lipoprotein SlyB